MLLFWRSAEDTAHHNLTCSLAEVAQGFPCRQRHPRLARLLGDGIPVGQEISIIRIWQRVRLR